MQNHIYYTFLAGWCADAAGARLEFSKKRFTEEEANDAIHFIGYKTTAIPEGQFTDDSEMELCLLTGLLKGNQDLAFPTERIAQEYIQWNKSGMFDMGYATKMALLNANNANDMANNAYKYNEHSESNGSLMRCLPIAVFCINNSPSIIFQVASVDASLTHYSKTVHLITGIYCYIISTILSYRIYRPTETIDVKNLIQMAQEFIIKNDVADSNSHSKVLTWLFYALELGTLSDYDSIRNEGHVKHAFTFFIYFLNNIDRYTYEKAITEVFMCGGDTDTNGKIVGNLFGAYYGDCVPNYMKTPVLQFDCTKAPKHFRRPDIYGVQHGIKLIQDNWPNI